MKTATIRVYHVFGTKSLFASDIFYRGKMRAFFEGKGNPQTYTDKAQAWAHANGFTHTKVIFG